MTKLAPLALLLIAAMSPALAQPGYGPYGYPYGNQYGYPYSYPGTYYNPYYTDPSTGYQYDAYGNLLAPPATGTLPDYGYGPGVIPTQEQLMAQMQAYGDAIEAQMAQMQQQIDTSMAEVERMFAQYYRDHTGDMQTPDAQAAQLGQNLWCQNNPVECQQSNQQAAAWMQQSAAAHQQRMAQNQAAFSAYQESRAGVSAAYDASFNSWMAQQNALYEANQGFIQGVIYEEGNYTNPTSGQTMSLPFAPSNDWSYRSAAGNPLWFDQTNNIWYEVDPAGNYTPYYGQ